MAWLAAAAMSRAFWVISEPWRASRATFCSDSVICAIDSATDPTLRLVSSAPAEMVPTFTDTSSLADEMLATLTLICSAAAAMPEMLEEVCSVAAATDSAWVVISWLWASRSCDTPDSSPAEPPSRPARDRICVTTLHKASAMWSEAVPSRPISSRRSRFIRRVKSPAAIASNTLTPCSTGRVIERIIKAASTSEISEPIAAVEMTILSPSLALSAAPRLSAPRRSVRIFSRSAKALSQRLTNSTVFVVVNPRA